MSGIRQVLPVEGEGGGGGEEQLYPVEIPTEYGGGMYTLPSEGDYPVGSFLILTAPGGNNGVYVFAAIGESIDGEMNLTMNGAMTIYLQATGTGSWHREATAPAQRVQELAEGGDSVVLPALADVPYGAVYEVVHNGTGNSTPVVVSSTEGTAIFGEPISIPDLYDARVFINTGFGSWQMYSKA